MVVWLRANGYLADISMGSVVLYNSIEKAKSREPMYNIDYIFNARLHCKGKAAAKDLYD
jgi:hypothetical protein